jgi:hypothetical protein
LEFDARFIVGAGMYLSRQTAGMRIQGCSYGILRETGDFFLKFAGWSPSWKSGMGISSDKVATQDDEGVDSLLMMRTRRRQRVVHPKMRSRTQPLGQDLGPIPCRAVRAFSLSPGMKLLSTI